MYYTIFRLCLVRVKAFLENKKCYFPERKMFLCVWLYFKKNFEKYFLVFGKCYKEKTNSENTDKTQIDARCLTGFNGAVLRELQFDDRAVDHDLAKHRFASQDRDRRRDLTKRRSRSREGEIAISNCNRRHWC